MAGARQLPIRVAGTILRSFNSFTNHKTATVLRTIPALLSSFRLSHTQSHTHEHTKPSGILGDTCRLLSDRLHHSMTFSSTLRSCSVTFAIVQLYSSSRFTCVLPVRYLCSSFLFVSSPSPYFRLQSISFSINIV